MRFTTLQAAIGSASLFLSAQPVFADSHGHHGHRHIHDQFQKRHGHGHHPKEELPSAPVLEKRSTCSLPDHPDLVFVPGEKNGGFAMAGDVACTSGKYCPIACVTGKVMAQWKPNTTYNGPEQSMVSGFVARVAMTGADGMTGRRSLLQQRCC